ncbi:hypothetical protein NDN08_005477 [Rhodosorus marinus]|uniref:DJ-1/PfpI domain-containing protein n=1 Tax=Rhodosorus marinus TaxID=101924 RepID=A0AAV8V4T7_9RHOD|nr:hypothetical protein NDN08_005477 [Rhodosorus marinus]
MAAFVLSGGVGLGTGCRVSRCGLERTSLYFGGSVVGRRARTVRGRVSSLKRQVSMNAKTALVAIGNGSEEIEATTIADTLVRAGVEVTIASVEDELVCTMSRGVKIMADQMIGDCKDVDYDLIALPGGMPGAERLRDSDDLKNMLIKQEAGNKMIGAICAAPAVVLAHHGLLEGRNATCYPSPAFMEKLPKNIDDDEVPVVYDGNVMTSRGPGTALVFSLALVEKLVGDVQAEQLASLMLLDIREDWTTEFTSDTAPEGATVG